MIRLAVLLLLWAATTLLSPAEAKGFRFSGSNGASGALQLSKATTAKKLYLRPKVQRRSFLQMSKHGSAAQHVVVAQRAGHPSILTTGYGKAATKANRSAAMKGIAPKKGLDRDEYPPAMFREGGKKASVRHINPSENRSAGSCIGHQCKGLPKGSKVKIIVAGDRIPAPIKPTFASKFFGWF